MPGCKDWQLRKSWHLRSELQLLLSYFCIRQPNIPLNSFLAGSRDLSCFIVGKKCHADFLQIFCTRLYELCGRFIQLIFLSKCQTHLSIYLTKNAAGGQSKRVNVALALVSNPRVLFLDEPTSGLDSFTANEVISQLCGQPFFPAKLHSISMLFSTLDCRICHKHLYAACRRCPSTS